MSTGIEGAIGTARAVGDLGVLVVIAGFYLAVTMMMIAFIFKWFKQIIDGVIKDQQGNMQELLEVTRQQNETLQDLSDALSPETLNRVRIISSALFDVSMYEVFFIVDRLRDENNIADREALREKIRNLIGNIHEDRNGKLDAFRYHGHTLSYYTDEKWKDQVAGLVEMEVLSVKNQVRTKANLMEGYKKIKIEFNRALIRK